MADINPENSTPIGGRGGRRGRGAQGGRKSNRGSRLEGVHASPPDDAAALNAAPLLPLPPPPVLAPQLAQDLEPAPPATIADGVNAAEVVLPAPIPIAPPAPVIIPPPVAVAAQVVAQAVGIPVAPTNPNWKDDEVSLALRIIFRIKPFTDEMWAQVIADFNRDTPYGPRNLKSLMEKFRKLKSMKKPTGTATANAFHKAALKCESAIRGRTATFGVDDINPSGEDDELDELEAQILGNKTKAPTAQRQSLEWDGDVLVMSTDSESDVQLLVQRKVSTKRKSTAGVAPPARPAQVARRESSRIPGPRTATSQLHHGLWVL